MFMMAKTYCFMLYITIVSNGIYLFAQRLNLNVIQSSFKNGVVVVQQAPFSFVKPLILLAFPGLFKILPWQTNSILIMFLFLSKSSHFFVFKRFLQLSFFLQFLYLLMNSHIFAVKSYKINSAYPVNAISGLKQTVLRSKTDAMRSERT